ncbi:ESAT-6 protein secretion system EspG family protein [Lentzea atacamensis]|uniref:ESAT-6 protein secretion system EspG family protein n=2 Tax=Lentzea TaxID=165301 RepID=A0A316HPV2_9PSEU|nr:ESX secretion-associated protein EspG [Lentzea atacamensis]PWK82189.1 ESAT-6 protein secretion system EspG family protein [Lentzea atacamensis]RAS64723.1 ESAT-6 protein secretion system EspG family protein [Lentzea atacamensis]
MLRSRVAIPVTALYQAWQAAGLPSLHRALLTQVEFDEDRLESGDLSELERLQRLAWAQLEAYGLARGSQVHPDLANALRLVMEAGVEYWAFFSLKDGPQQSVLVVSNGQDALRIVLTPEQQFVLEPVRPEEAPQALVGALPPTPAGKGNPITLPEDALEQKRQSYEDTGSFMQQSRPTSTPNDQLVAQLKEIMNQPRIGGGQVYSAKRDHLGRKQRCIAPLTYIDTTSGRYIAAKSEGWLRVQPADFGTLAHLTATMP